LKVKDEWFLNGKMEISQVSFKYLQLCSHDEQVSYGFRMP